jgi:uncharacterized Fe-S radical SAM superfamily protein PflX
MAEADLMSEIEKKIEKTRYPIFALIKDSHGEKIKSNIMKKYNAKAEDFSEFYRSYITK